MDDITVVVTQVDIYDYFNSNTTKCSISNINSSSFMNITTLSNISETNN